MFSATRTLAVLLMIATIFSSLAPIRVEAQDSTPKPVWLLHIPGMGGKLWVDRMLTTGLLDGGIDADIEIYDWTGADRGLVALAQVKRHEAQSTLVAGIIVRHARENPTQRIIVTSHSAGAGIIVWALEKLPDDVMVDDLVFIAPALSPQYDLSKALKHVRHKAYSFNSELDAIVLGAGTKMFGTVDRVNTDSAGRVGFRMPTGADARQYAKLRQIPYDSDWMRFDNFGEHIGPMMRPFAKNVIASILLGHGLPPRAAPTTRASTTRPATEPVP